MLREYVSCSGAVTISKEWVFTDWFDYEWSGGSIVITYGENTGDLARNGTLYIEYAGITHTISLTQQGVPCDCSDLNSAISNATSGPSATLTYNSELNVYYLKEKLPASGGTATVARLAFGSNCTVTNTAPEGSGIHFYQEDNVLKVRAEENPGTTERNLSLSLSVTGLRGEVCNRYGILIIQDWGMI